MDPGLPNARPTESYWQSPPHTISSHQSKSLPEDATIVIIGSGITGTSIAHHLLKESPDLEVVILEARTITSGATGRNGGHCKDVPFKTYKKWKTELGQKAAQRLVRFRGSHIQATRQLALQLREQGVADAQFRDVESVTAVYDPAVLRDLTENMEEWLKDFPDQRGSCSIVSGADAKKKYGFIGACGALTLPAGALWPYRLVTGLLQCLLRDHAGFHFSLEAHTPVLSITATEDISKPYAVHTSRGVIRARHVVHCTNGHAAHLLPALRGKIVPVRGQMSTLIPPDTFPRLGHERSWSTYWPNGGFDYMTQAGDSRGHVFLGGGLEQGAEAGVVDFDRANDSEINTPALDHLCKVLPTCFDNGRGTKLLQAWTGVMGFTPDDFPIVGKLPQELSPTKTMSGALGSEWIAAGFNGYGMVHCWQSGRAIAEMLLGHSQASIDEYFPSEQFECSAARLGRMDFESMKASFYKNAPAGSRL